jgi:hypothetical protein
MFFLCIDLNFMGLFVYVPFIKTMDEYNLEEIQFKYILEIFCDTENLLKQ